ncbi:MAG: isoprenylcysteine carboxylmethyltransferase family protein [Anaerolineales bacterium]|jgi:protein-S-isoprenylcysteine O-methyltransferase Ste14
MTTEKLLHIIFSVLFIVFLFERGYFQFKAMRVSGEARKWGENKIRLAGMVLLFLAGQIWVIGTFIYIFNPVFLAWTIYSLPIWVRWLGAAIALAGMVLEFSTQLHLGRNYSTTLHISEEQSLVTTGPYRHIRHPMYTALFTVGIGLGLLSTSWYFLLPFIVTGIVVAFRVGREEEAMIEKFGGEYVQYMGRTGRFLPPIF